MISSTNRAPRLGVDIGGMFAGVTLATPEERIENRSVLSTPDNDGRGTLDVIAAVLGQTWLVHATTVGTNAIREHEGARTGLVTTHGFRGVFEMHGLRIPDLRDFQNYRPKWPNTRGVTPEVVCKYGFGCFTVTRDALARTKIRRRLPGGSHA